MFPIGCLVVAGCLLSVVVCCPLVLSAVCCLVWVASCDWLLVAVCLLCAVWYVLPVASYVVSAVVLLVKHCLVYIG